MFDTSKLRGRIVEKYETLGAFAEVAGCTKSFLSAYLKGKKDLRQGTIERWAKLLEIADSDIFLYFFSPNSSQNEN